LAEIPDLIIMDLWLPGMSGVEATVKIKANPKTVHIPIIAYTASEHEDYREKALAAGMVEFLIKPTPSRVFRAVLERYLKTSP
jgi:CheY-like chemotaxis protein